MQDNKYKEVAWLIIRTSRLHRKLAESHATSAKIHPSQHKMLMQIAHSDTAPTQCELARQFEISPAAVTVTLRKLEKLGYIEKSRSDSDGDGRVNEIKITPKGRKEAFNSNEYFAYVDEVLFSNFSDAELEELKRLLEKTYQNLQKADEKSEEKLKK